MATLLMRTPELAVAEKLAIGNQLHNEKALGHGEQEGHHKTSGEGRSRARKGKSGQKKQPQRGLGVAQLEKLRLQEQSKQEAACVASLQTLPSFGGFTDQNQNGGMCFRPIKDAISHHHNNGRGSTLPFGYGRLGPSDKLAEYFAREGHRHVGKGTVDGDVFRTFISLASSTDHSRSVSLSQHERGPSVSIMLPARRKDDSETPFVCNNPQAETLGNKVHGSPSSHGTEGSPARRASCALACVASPPNCVRTSYFSSALISRASPADSHPSNVEIGDEKRMSAEMANPKESVVPHVFFPVSNNGVVEVGMINAKLLPVIVKAGAGAPIFTLTNLQCFESSLGPATVGRLPRDRTNVPVVVGVAANCDRPKELSSFQSFSSNQSWSTPDKTCGWKRPWQALNKSTCKLLHSGSLDLNAIAGEIDAAYKDSGSAGVAEGQQSAVGAHHSEGIIRTASEDCSLPPFKIRVCGTWDENRQSKGVAVRDVDLYSDESLNRCTPESKSKDSCPSVFPPSSLTLNRRRCLSSPEIQFLTGSDHQKSGDFLTLGPSSYPASPQLEVEVNSEEATIPEESFNINQADISSKEAHDISQLQMCYPQQVQQMRSYEFISGEGSTAHARFSCRFSSVSSGNVTEHCHKRTGRKKEESLDLRLKL